MAGNNWNPNSPSTAGLEWFINGGNLRHDLALVGPWAQRIRSRVAETIVAARLLADLYGPSSIIGEVIPAGSEVPSGVQTVAYYEPNGDQTVTAWVNQAGAAVNLFQSIDEGIDSGGPVSLTDYITCTNAAANQYRVRFASSAFSATARVLQVKLKIVYSANAKGATTNFSVAVGQNGGAAGVAVAALSAVGTTPVTTIIDCGEIDPVGSIPWTPGNVAGLASAVPTRNVQIFTLTDTNMRIYALELQVTYQSVENRVAAFLWQNLAVTGLLSGEQAALTVTGLPAGGTSWAKPVSGDFTILFRRPNWIFAAGYPPQVSPLLWYSAAYLDGAIQANSIPGVSSALPVVDQFGQVTSIDFTNSSTGKTPMLGVYVAGPTISADSLPFTSVIVPVSATATITQRITAPASSTYNVLTIDLYCGASASAAINIKVKRNSDNVQFGSTVTLTPAQVRAFPASGVLANTYRVAVVMTSGAALISGTQYYVELTTTDATSLIPPAGWGAYVADAQTLTQGDTASFNGATDRANEGGGLISADIPVILSTQPASPTNPAAAVVLTTTANWAVSQSGCGVQQVQQVRVTWTKTTLGASFLRYEIQRTEDLGVTWNTVAYISAEATQTWTDGETPRGTAVQYRIRVVRTDLVQSNYTAATNGATAQAIGCEMIFVSNEQPTLMVAYNREPNVKFQYLAAGRDRLLQIYGADYQVAFMESEDPGVAFDAVLTVNFKDAPIRDDIAIFAPIRAMARTPASYVCVLDYTGSRFFAHLQFPEGDWEEPGYQYHAVVSVTEISGSPSIAVA